MRDRTSQCDICDIKTNNISDYFAMICPECKDKYTDTRLLKKISYLYARIEDLGQEKTKR